MTKYTFFEIDQYEAKSILTLTESAGTRDLQNGALRVELEAFILTAKPRCVLVSFAKLKRCPSSLIGTLIALNRTLTDRGIQLKLCEMNPQLQEHFHRINLDRLFEIHHSLADAFAACEQSSISKAQRVPSETDH